MVKQRKGVAKTVARKSLKKETKKEDKKLIQKETKKETVSVPDTMKLATSRDIAYDFALKTYKRFDQIIKSIVLFGSAAKKKSTSESDIDILIIIDDVSLDWDEELIAWYREELQKVIAANPYVRPLHVNTVKLSTWWADVMRGDPVAINVIRYGQSLVDFGGFFSPLKVLLHQGKIRPTAEAIYTLLQRAPHHTIRARQSMLAAVDGLYWTMIDSAHAVLIALEITPPSPEDIPEIFMKVFVRPGKLDKKFVYYYDEIHTLAKQIMHGKVTYVPGRDIDKYFENTDLFIREMGRLVKHILEEREMQERKKE